MTEIEEKAERKAKQLDRKAVWITILPLFFVIIAPFLFTQSGWVDFSGTGAAEIGSTIGGTTAPIVGLIAALLVYIGFREQYKANVSQWAALEEEKGIRESENKKREQQGNHELLWKLVDDSIIKLDALSVDKRTNQDYRFKKEELDHLKAEFLSLVSELSYTSVLLLELQYEISVNHLSIFRLKINDIYIKIGIIRSRVDELFRMNITHPKLISIKQIIDSLG